MDIQAQKQFNVLVVGDSCEDVYHYGTCERISPEGPVPILKQSRVEIKPGMSANVVSNLKSFGMSITHITNDEPIKKHRFVSERYNQHMLRVDEGESVPLCHVDIKKIEKLSSDIDAVVISDYDKGFLTHSCCRQISDRFSSIPVFVDSKKNDLSCFKNSIIKINEKESRNMYGLPSSSELITTLGAKGTLYQDKIYETSEVEVFDVCGAGDVFLSALVYFYLLTNDVEASIIFANKCASYSVSKFGTYVLSKEEIYEISRN